MHIKSLPEFKKSKPFYTFDIFIYSALAVFIILLFLAALFKPVAGNFNGFYIIYNNEKIAEYSFLTNSLKIQEGYSDYIRQSDDGIYFYPNSEKTGEYNLIVANNATKAVRVTVSTCAGHDCERQVLSSSGGFIYCAPHNLKITAMGLSDPVTG